MMLSLPRSTTAISTQGAVVNLIRQLACTIRVKVERHHPVDSHCPVPLVRLQDDGPLIYPDNRKISDSLSLHWTQLWFCHARQSARGP